MKIVSRKLDCCQEINLLRACQGHKNIVKLHEVVQDSAHTYLVFELLKGGELLERIRKRDRFTEAEASRIMKQLVSALSFLHGRGIVHRDLKPENLLFTDSSDQADIKIVDFGFARIIDQNEAMKTPCFTLEYAAPEVLRQAASRGSDGYDENCDLWSLGVVLYTMLSGRAPFHAGSRDESAASVMKRIRGGQFDFSDEAWKHVSPSAKRITQGLLTVDPLQRLRMPELLQNVWLHSGSSHSQTPLMTPGVLSSRVVDDGVRQTFVAFHKAHKAGFRLQVREIKLINIIFYYTKY